MQTQSNPNPVKLSIRKDDLVEVIAGREKGKSGKVVRVDTKTARITVERVNMVKKHMKPTRTNPQGGVVEKELPLHCSNVLLMCPKCNRGVRHGVQMKKESRVRVCKKCGTSLDKE